jgi:carbonic anhydrase
MKQLLKPVALAVVACGMFVAPVHADSVKCPVGQIATKGVCAKPTNEQALELLLEGNQNFVKGKVEHLDKYSDPAIRKEVALGQHPYAIILACSDSRVPPEVLFDKGLGEIFVVRVAGNIVERHELGSIEYAIEHLGASLIMVLGHERCGAVTAAFNANGISDGSNIGSLIESIAPAVIETKAAGGDVEECIISNVKKVAEELEVRSPAIIKEGVESGKVKIVRAKYDLDDGIVTVLGE